MHKLYESAYGKGTITARVRSNDNVLDIDTAFRFNKWEVINNKKCIVLYGEDDVKIVITPQNLIRAKKENELFIFNTNMMEMIVDFI